ncbi:MAG: recombinase family protein, partial [Methylococcales bacterium]|nr:recombinase family protein [Methylococcales bacterium]
MKTAAIYARVSTQRQADEATIATQIAQLEQFAATNHFHIKPEHRFIDEAVSGKGLHRPALTRLRDMSMTGDFTTILCLGPDRLSRNLGIQQLLLAEWKNLNIDFRFIHRPPSGNSANDTLLLNIEGAFAEYERMVICDRMRRGRRYKLHQGQSATWPAPYGYHYLSATGQAGSRWEVDPIQAAIVKQIFTWYTEDRLPISAVVKRLNAQHIQAPKGGMWGYTTISRLLCQPAYKGTAYYGRTRQDFSGLGQPRKQGQGRLQCPRTQARPVEEWIPVAVSPLVTEQLWQQAQGQRQMNAQTAKRNSRRTYLLRGLLVCGICGGVLQGRAQNEHIYYRCPHGGKQRKLNMPQHTCSVRGDVVEAQVWQALTDLLGQPEQIESAWVAYQATQTEPPSQISHWKQRQQQLQAQRRRLVDAYQGGVLELEELTERQNPIVVELRMLTTRLAGVKQTEAVTISLEQFISQTEQALQARDMNDKQAVIRLLIEKIVVEDGALIIHHIVPTTENSQLEPAFGRRRCALRFQKYLKIYA